MKQVYLKWRGPYGLSRVPNDWGIYAICRKWGERRETVLYIGLTYFQDLVRRLRRHKWWLDELRGNIGVRFAAIELEEGSKQSEKRAKDIEALLTYYCQPQYNTQNKKSYRGRKLEITSYGRREPIERRICSTDL